LYNFVHLSRLFIVCICHRGDRSRLAVGRFWGTQYP